MKECLSIQLNEVIKIKIMSVDFGDARTGIAISDPTEFLASPVCVVHEYNFDKTVLKVAQIAKEKFAEQIVVGYPKNMNGTVGERAEKCLLFAEKLRENVDVEVVMWDERSTTVTAHGFLNETGTFGKKRKEVIDAVAATIILENYLSYRKNNVKD